MLKYCFEKLKCERVEFRVREDNLFAQSELKSLGAVLEGTMRERIVDSDGSTYGCMIYSFLREEWAQIKVVSGL